MKGEKSMNIVEMLLKNEIENETTSELTIMLFMLYWKPIQKVFLKINN